ncbi:hypothetical protein EDD53_2159 [Pacificibacter maritimus]|uniref:Uncharacterized protein n=1 Tax=Pacificibacter maritimus TaxID=762213 RepID=A0A3N4U6R3_9RHOB|nr:hypothetical protein EDD53_2159 [Pacificibacter maritimus]
MSNHERHFWGPGGDGGIKKGVGASVTVTVALLNPNASKAVGQCFNDPTSI